MLGGGGDEVSGRQRDDWFHGLHAPELPPGWDPDGHECSDDDTEHRDLVDLDLYGTLAEKHVRLSVGAVRAMYGDVRERLLRALAGLNAAQLRAAREPSINPLDWTVGHVAHFYEFMALRLLAPHAPPLALEAAGHDAHALFDSFRAAHDDRWAPGLGAGSDPPLESIQQYLADVTAACLATLDDTEAGGEGGLLDPVRTYLHTYAILHEHWHVEDIIQARHTLRYPAPRRLPAASTTASVVDAWGGTLPAPTDAQPLLPACKVGGGALPGYTSLPGGHYRLGADKADRWVFDAERWGHDVRVRPFQIARACVTNAEYAAFIAAGGYRRQELWSHEGWRWLQRQETVVGQGARSAPRRWLPRSEADTDSESRLVDGHTGPLRDWAFAQFDGQPSPLRPHTPVCHVSWFEASAYCAWVGGRLPTEAEWELAARTVPANVESGIHDSDASIDHRRTYPWGEAPPAPALANLDGFRGGALDVGALPDGDSAWGCHQMLGNVWEWTTSAFLPFPGFVMDFPYRENSAPWFGYRKVVKGGCWATSAPIARAGYRHSFWPDMDAVFTGFRVVLPRAGEA